MKQRIQWLRIVSLDEQRLSEYTLGNLPEKHLIVDEVLGSLQSHFKRLRKQDSPPEGTVIISELTEKPSVNSVYC